MKTIVETAIEAGSFKTLVQAVKAAGLVDTLSGKGPFTVFARQTRRSQTNFHAMACSACTLGNR